MRASTLAPLLLLAAFALSPFLSSAQAAPPPSGPPATAPGTPAAGNPVPSSQETKPQTQEPKKISNVFVDTDVKQALQDLGATAKVTIVPDETVQGTVSCELKDVTLERALDIVLAGGGMAWVKMDGFYLVGKPEPTNPNFLLFAATQVYKPNHTTGERIAALLPEQMKQFVKAANGDRFLTVTAAPRMLARILADIKLIDTAPPKVLLEALVTEMTSETLNQFDLSWIWKNFGMSGNGDGIELKYTKASQSDVATLKSMIAIGMAEVRANPRIMTVEGKEALVEVAQESYFQVVTGPVNFPYTTLQVIKTGISLKMTPTLSDDGQITVQLAPEVSDAIGSGAGGLPINTVRRANTTVRVKAGETIVIGGMTYESKRRKEQRVPILADIPLIGGLFRSFRNESKKTEIVIMITPRIVKDDP